MDISIYTYLDYRHFLQDIFNALKKKDASFSYRTFARMAKSTSPNFYQLITARKLNINNTQLDALSKALDLSKKEEDYFETIVAFDHAKTHQEKDKYFQRILITREYYSIKTIETRQYEYLSHWYNPIIRELITDPAYPGDPAWIAEQIIPAITPGKARKGIEVLRSLNLIQKVPDGGGWIQTNPSISTPSEVLSMAIVKYHQDSIMLGKNAIELFGPEERDFRSVTIGISKEGYDELKQRMEAFWKEILAFSETQKPSYRVVQMNMQMFPVSVAKENRK